MRRVGRNRNPLSLLLILVAIVFSLSGWLYYLATIRALHAADVSREGQGAAALMQFFRDHGTAVLLIELVVLAMTALVVVFTDGHGPRRGK